MILSTATSSSSGTTCLADDLEVTRIEPRALVMRRVQMTLGVTRWKSPPPGVSWRAVLLVVLLGDLGLVLLALDIGLINP